MNEFLEKLYTNEYFPIILFSAIGILAILFVIILIMALRDAKKNNKLPEETENNLNHEEKEPVLPIPVSEEKEQFEDISFELPKKENVDFDTLTTMEKIPDIDPIAVELPKIEPVASQVPFEIPKSIVNPPTDNLNNVSNVSNSLNTEMPKPNLNENIPKEPLSEPVKVLTTDPVINVKSLNDIQTEEYRLK